MSSENLFIEAVISGDVQTVNLLLSQGDRANDERDGKSALFIAVEKNYFDITQQLIKNGANVDFICNTECGRTALHIAMKNGNIDIVNVLLNSNASGNAKTNSWNDRQSPLHYAVKYCGGKEEIIEIIENLVNKGANINSRNERNETVLHLAAKSGFAEMLEHLLRHKIYLNAKDKDGNTALHYAGASVNGKKVVEILLKRGAKLYEKNKQRQTILHTAANYAHAEIIELLLQYDFNVNAGGWYNTPLHIILASTVLVADEKRKRIVELLLEKGARLHFSYIHTAANYGHGEAIKLLVNWGASVNNKNYNGETPLYIAVEANKANAAVALLECGADINLESDYNGRQLTPFQLICEENISHNLTCCLTRHVARLIAQNMYVSQVNLEILNSSEKIAEFYFKCKKEIETMNIKFNDNFTFTYFDIFSKNIQMLSKYARNINVIISERSDFQNILKDRFPIYFDVIANCLYKAIERRKQIDKCIENLNFFSNRLPFLTLESIYDYLSERDLKNVISAFLYTEQPIVQKPCKTIAVNRRSKRYSVSLDVLNNSKKIKL